MRSIAHQIGRDEIDIAISPAKASVSNMT